MRNIRRSLALVVFVHGLMLQLSAGASAQSAAAFWIAKEIRLVVGFPPGGGVDAYARIVAAHLGRHLPGRPAVVVQNMPGANSLTAANWIYNSAPRDGSAIAAIHATVATEPLYGSERAKFDIAKLSWIGSASTDFGVMLTWGPSPTKTLREARLRETTMGGMGGVAAADLVANLANRFLSTQFKLVTGYRGTNEIVLAMERGEVEGIGNWTWSALQATRPDWIADKKVNFLMQVSVEPHPELTKLGVPSMLDLVAADSDRLALELGLVFMSVGRPFVAPPGLPSERFAALRKAFADMIVDQRFLAEAESRRIEIASPKTGAELDELFQRLLATPRGVIDQVARLRQMP